MSRRSTPTPTSTSRPSPGSEPIERGATLDRSGRYRFLLTRRWATGEGIATFVMLNPSTADARIDDPTIRRCIALARRWGFGGIDVVNLFAYRATKPADLLATPRPVGPGNDAWTLRACAEAKVVVLAWGAIGHRQPRAAVVLDLVSSVAPPHCLGLTREGAPRHPLYVRAGVTPAPYAPVIPAR